MVTLGIGNVFLLENQGLKKRVKDLEEFLFWCIEEGGRIQDFVLALNPDKELDEIIKITKEYTEKYK
jgi:hypothetical protein